MSVAPSAAFAAARTHMAGPFLWGRSDCCIAACRAFEALHDCNPLAGHPGWDGPVSALRILRRAGSYLAWAEAQFARAGLRPVEVLAPGDLALSASDGLAGGALMLCIQPGEFAGKSPWGLTVSTCNLLGGWQCA